jgi:hypothetical protein
MRHQVYGDDQPRGFEDLHGFHVVKASVISALRLHDASNRWRRAASRLRGSMWLPCGKGERRRGSIWHQDNRDERCHGSKVPSEGPSLFGVSENVHTMSWPWHFHVIEYAAHP